MASRVMKRISIVMCLMMLSLTIQGCQIDIMKLIEKLSPIIGDIIKIIGDVISDSKSKDTTQKDDTKVPPSKADQAGQKDTQTQPQKGEKTKKDTELAGVRAGNPLAQQDSTPPAATPAQTDEATETQDDFRGR